MRTTKSSKTKLKPNGDPEFVAAANTFFDRLGKPELALALDLPEIGEYLRREFAAAGRPELYEAFVKALRGELTEADRRRFLRGLRGKRKPPSGTTETKTCRPRHRKRPTTRP